MEGCACLMIGDGMKQGAEIELAVKVHPLDCPHAGRTAPQRRRDIIPPPL
jgi:hypothetical protein